MLTGKVNEMYQVIWGIKSRSRPHVLPRCQKPDPLQHPSRVRPSATPAEISDVVAEVEVIRPQKSLVELVLGGLDVGGARGDEAGNPGQKCLELALGVANADAEVES